MRTGLKAIFAIACSATAVAAITIAFSIILKPANAMATPVEYVKVCEIYGAGYFYLPGTDICVDFATNDAREQTPDGTWEWIMPNNSRSWTPFPQTACLGGNLVKFADISSSNLTLNAHARYETTTHYPLKLKPGQYISSVLYKGGFTGVDFAGEGNFCMFYYYNDPTYGAAYSPFGCIDTAPEASVPAALTFSPLTPIPPVTSNQVYVLGANGSPWDQVQSPSDIQGTLSVWLCLQPGLPF